ncbi:MAG: undecaprenyl/decaprenyl-phosphate alpha-N-acetylglucosaminyl 1-phosphate transferase [Deltaproteobacteria bacterium]|nr:undecaprenyl/decaprenyl-phosphate alpha-N-acetylglucosaminyl 1-phosphate transferase [Deltaproteobacteria bacterium]
MDGIRAIAIVLVAAGVAALATPFVMRFAVAVGAVDRPNERKVSRRERMPLLGGLAVATGCVAGLVLATIWPGGPEIWPKAAGFLLGAAVLVGVGFFDDRFTIRASVKFGFQVVAALVAVQAGFRVDLFSDPITVQTYEVPIWVMLPISLVWIVGVTNAMNLIDGLDGLSSGLGAIIAATLTIICWQADQWVGVVIGLALFGALIGYLPYNFPPARIFLGDTGSLLIGFGLSVLALEGYRKAAFLAFIVPILALAIPLLDTLLSIARRIRSGRSMFSPDKLHMHHRLLVREGSHKNAVLMLYFLTSCFCMIAISFAQIDGWLAFVYLAAVVAVTIRLLRNLDAFSLDGPAAPKSDETDPALSVPGGAPANDEVGERR